MHQRGLGYIPDSHDKSRDVSIRALLGARMRSPNPTSFLKYLTAVHDQGKSSTCVGFTFAEGVQLSCAAIGTPIEFPSPTAIYVGALAIERKNSGKDPSTPLIDAGCQPLLAVQSMSEWGIPADTQWPLGGFDENRVTEEPTLEQLQASSSFELHQMYRINEGTETTLDDVQRALEHNPVAIGSQIDKAFQDYDGKSVLGPPVNDINLIGGHMQLIIGWHYDAKGNVVFIMLNSWGRGWGDSGLYYVSPAYLTSKYVSDIVSIQVAAK